MTKKNIALALVLSFITLGIYAIYWIYTITEDAHIAAGQRTTSSGGKVILFHILTCGLYSFYWLYKIGEAIVIAKERRFMMTDRNLPIIYLALALFGFGVVSYALMQNALNEIVDHDATGEQDTLIVQDTTTIDLKKTL